MRTFICVAAAIVADFIVYIFMFCFVFMRVTCFFLVCYVLLKATRFLRVHRQVLRRNVEHDTTVEISFDVHILRGTPNTTFFPKPFMCETASTRPCTLAPFPLYLVTRFVLTPVMNVFVLIFSHHDKIKR